MNGSRRCPGAAYALLLAAGTWGLAAPAAETVPLAALDLSELHQSHGKPQVNRGMRSKQLSIAGQVFAQGVGTQARSLLWMELDGQVERFQAQVGVDDGANNPQASVNFSVLADGKVSWQSGVMHLGDAARPVDVPLEGVRRLCLLAGDAGDGDEADHADWAEARFLLRGQPPRPVNHPPEEPQILTPPAGPEPRINGPTVYGCRPGHPFLYRIPCTGQRPMQFAAGGLPAGLALDPASGVITGTSPAAGEYRLDLQARNGHGQAVKSLRIVAGETLSLTPSMGWNHWYAHYNRITDAMLRQAADVMLSSGMADAGYQYVSVDDCWMNASPEARHNQDPQRVGPFRDAADNLRPNAWFPDMRALTDYIHGRGLKAGIYISPGPLTCAGFAGSYGHEAQDARQFAEWGFDFLKYDWCSYGQVVKGDTSLEALQKPYRLMGGLLRQQKRDILLNLCQYGRGNVWEWGAEVGGQSWRTSGDLGFELNRVFEVALANVEHRAFSRPGAWNDPDYLQIGAVGAARALGEPRPCPLSPTEQYSFMSLWCLMAAPLFYSGDMSRLDAFTVNVLCNPEVIAVDQDPLGECARPVPLGEETFLLVKRLEGGAAAVGLCNRGELPAAITARWSDLGLSGPQAVRDLWRQKDLGVLAEQFSASVGRRGVVLVRLEPAKSKP